MLYGVFSDVHGNLEALNAVLAFFEKSGVDAHVFCGDLVGCGPDPEACVRRVQELGWRLTAVCGDHDQAALEDLDPESFDPSSRESVRWTRSALSEGSRSFLSGLASRFDGPLFSVVHGTPRNPTGECLLTASQFMAAVPKVSAWPLFVGHSHLPLCIRGQAGQGTAAGVELSHLEGPTPIAAGRGHRETGPIVLSPGSVGQPLDLDWRASCALFDSEAMSFRVVRLEYDVKTVQRKLKKAGMAEVLGLGLAEGRGPEPLGGDPPAADYKAGRFEDAAQGYREACRLNPGSVAFLCGLGRTLVRLNKLDEAAAQFQAALKSDPRHASSLYHFALCLDAQGKGAEALAGYEEFLRNASGEPRYVEEARKRVSELKRAEEQKRLEELKRRPAARATVTMGDVLGPRPDSAAAGSAPAPAVPGPPAGQVPVWKVGEVIEGLYEVSEVLGEGGFGSVHKVRHLVWRMDLAVKSPREDRVSQRRAMERFVQEANTWVGLGFHPNIVTCFFVRLIGGIPRIFLEYLEAGTLADWLEQRKIVDARAAMDLMIQLARAMERVQDRGLVHRDLKPENCLMAPSGVLKVTDFGLVKVGLEEEIPAGDADADRAPAKASAGATRRVGTPEYMAPEQWFEAGKATPAADTWAFGVMLFELMCGKRPFRMRDGEPVDAFYSRMLERRWAFQFRDDAPEELKAIVAACLQPEPSKREPKFSILRQRLEALFEGLFREPYPREAVTQTPLLADTLSNQGVSLADLGRTDDALKLFSAALKQDPTHPGAMYNQGLLLVKEGKLTQEAFLARVSACKQARPKDAVPVRLVGLARRFGSPGAKPEFYVSLPVNAEAAGAEESRFNGLMAQARMEANAGRAAGAYEKVMRAREVKGHGRAPLALAMQSRLGRKGSRAALRAAWHKTLYEGSTGALCVAISPDGLEALSGHEDGSVRLWQLETGRLLKTLEQRSKPVRSVCFTAVGLGLAGGDDGDIKVWDPVSGKCVRTFQGAGPVNVVCPMPDGPRFLSAGRDGFLRLWSMEPAADQPALRISDPTAPIPGQNLLNKLWALQSDAGKRAIKAHEGPVAAACPSPDGMRAYSMGNDGVLKQWDVVERIDLGGPRRFGAAHSMAAAPDDRLVMVGREGKLSFVTSEGSQDIPRAGGHDRALAFTLDARFGFSGGLDKALRVWDLSSPASRKEPVWVLEGHQEAVDCVCISPDSRHALSGGKDGLRLWEFDWGYEFPEPADWDEGARPFVEAFLALRGLSENPDLFPQDVKDLVADLECRGYGWLRPDGLRARPRQEGPGSRGRGAGFWPPAEEIPSEAMLPNLKPIKKGFWGRRPKELIPAAAAVVAVGLVGAGILFFPRAPQPPGTQGVGPRREASPDGLTSGINVDRAPASSLVPEVGDAVALLKKDDDEGARPRPVLPSDFPKTWAAGGVDDAEFYRQGLELVKRDRLVSAYAAFLAAAAAGNKEAGDRKAAINPKLGTQQLIEAMRLARVLGPLVRPRQGVEWVDIPGGSFLMGSGRGVPDERPIHRVTLDSFRMARTETTVAQFRACVNSGTCSAPDEGGGCNWEKEGREDHPMNCVEWSQALAFCLWVGGRLPTEAEWEYAARSGGYDWSYPWGDGWAACERAVMNDGGMGCGRGSTWPVCSKTRGNTSHGLCDMAGNVKEWVRDWFDPTYYGVGSNRDPQGPDRGQYRVVRGGSWGDSTADSLRTTVRDRYSPGILNNLFGFRCASPAAR